MKRAHIKKNDDVVVIAGADRGKRGKVMKVDSEKARVTVEGINVRKRHKRRSQVNPQGGIEERENSIHISNVMLGKVYDASRKADNKPEGRAGAVQAEGQQDKDNQ